MTMTTTRRTSVVLERVARYAVVFFVLTSASLGCRKTSTSDDSGQIGAAVGEVMSGLDEASQGGTTTAFLRGLPLLRTPEQLKGPLWRRALGGGVAYAASCATETFTACAGGVRSKTFGNCTIGSATLDGSVSLTFSTNPMCVMSAAGDAITRPWGERSFYVVDPWGNDLCFCEDGTLYT